MAIQNQPATFMGVFGWGNMPIQARAVAYPGNGADAGCIYALETSGNGIDMSGNGALLVPKCSIYDNSDLHMNGATSITAGAVGVAGTVSGGGTITPTPVSISPVLDPLNYLPAATIPPSCITPTSPATLLPGYYCNLNGTYTLTGGLYIVGSGGVSGKVSNVGGSGVTLYLTNGGGVSLGGTNSLILTAEQCTTITGVCTDHAYNNVVIFEDRTDSAQFGYNDTAATLQLSGIMYMPSAELFFKGSPSSTLDASVVCNDLLMKGGPTFDGPPISGGIFPIKVATLEE